MDVIKGEQCPVCSKKTLELREDCQKIPHFGQVYIFSMTCSNCKFHKADVDCEETKDPCKHTIEIDCEEDLKIRVIKSSEATIKIPRIVTITPGAASNGYITNIEGIINRVKKQIEIARDNAEDKSARKKAKRHLKKIIKVLWGREKLKIIIEDPSGNSAIISDKTKKTKL
ncbi:MAG: hypothetical protein MAG795_00961 [Candidatus Woesearchaeota archaeon]|nr:hypothetical protein [Candidatus Woesearchaeota archaeon]